MQDYESIMNLNDALNHIIDDGIESARADYIKPEDKLKLEGSISGFEECRGKSPSEISALLVTAEERTLEAYRNKSPQYWYWRCYELEIQWVANVLSCIMHAQGWTPIGAMTANGLLKASEIIGVKETQNEDTCLRGT